MFKKHVVLFIFFVLSMVVCFIILGEFILIRLNEHVFLSSVIAMQKNNDSIFGSVLLSDDFSYKKHSAIIKKPDIIVLGSSRVMQFRKEMFLEKFTFYTTGGVMRQPIYGVKFIDELLFEYTPKVLILGVDMWWVNSNYNEEFIIRPDISEVSSIAYRYKMYNNAFKFLITNKNRSEIMKAISSNWSNVKDPISGNMAYGLMASMRGDGFRSDGSYQYGDFITKGSNYKEGIEETMKRVKQRVMGDRFNPSEHLDQERIDQLRYIIKSATDKKIKMIVFLPPFAHEVYKYMMSQDDYTKYLSQFSTAMKSACEEYGVEFYDFTDIYTCGSNDTETIDGFHGDERCYWKIAKLMDGLAPYRNSAFVN